MTLDDAQIRRYSRHVLLLDVGGVGQKRLLAGAVALARLDASGQAAAVYLAAAGVGRLLVHERGRVDAAGALFEAEDVGRDVVDAARERLAALNADCVLVDVADDAILLPCAPAVEPVAALAAGASAARQALRLLTRTAS